MNGRPPFRVAYSADILKPDGKSIFPEMGLEVLEGHPQISTGRLAENRPELGPDQVGSFNALIIGGMKVTTASLSKSDDLLAIGRMGVGYDNVDVEACTRADMLLTITSGAVDRPMAEATIGWMLALTHHVRTKDALVRAGQWDIRSDYMGCELRDRTLGVVGFGGIGGTTIELLQGFGMDTPIAYDPFFDADKGRRLGVKSVELHELMSSADFVSIHCPLNEKTTNLIGPAEISLMKPDAYLINTARGGIVDEDALFDALKNKRIAGAALDCLVGEPITSPHRFGELENVLLAPHCIGWTHELFRDAGRMASQAMVDLCSGKKPDGAVNSEVFERAGFQKKWERLRLPV